MAGAVILAPYDPEWPSRFDQEAVVLGAVFSGSDAAIEHVGSTAVPGLGAKPVIDIKVGLSHLAQAESRMGALEAAGYDALKRDLAARLGKEAYTEAKGPFVERIPATALIETRSSLDADGCPR
jgi:GrpB-like predicted nucleotidyltransferase (UPF0157 family)